MGIIQANMECQLVIDVHKAVAYMSKHIFKPGQNMSVEMTCMVAKIFESQLMIDMVYFFAEESNDVFLGLLAIPKQESSHLISRNSMVAC